VGISYHYDSNRNLVLAEARGVITVQDILTYTKSVIQDDAIQRDFVEVVDFEGVEDLVVTYRELSPFRDIWQKYITKGCKGTLILAPSDFSYGIFRMFQAVIGSDDFEAGGPFFPVRSHEELEARISEIGEAGPGGAPE
jgi:hypothetical protein